jgi:hypothetical protein
VHRIVTPFLFLMVAASIWPAAAFASHRSDTAKKDSVCDAYGRSIRAALSVPDDAGARPRTPDHPTATRKIQGARKLENVPIVFDGVGSRHEARTPADVADARQDTKLSLLENAPLPRQNGSLTKARDVSRPANNGLEAQWMRLDDSPIPEPGIWAMLVAGFLGICAVARPRIFSS